MGGRRGRGEEVGVRERFVRAGRMGGGFGFGGVGRRAGKDKKISEQVHKEWKQRWDGSALANEIARCLKAM
jgi:hypothetical protein